MNIVSLGYVAILSLCFIGKSPPSIDISTPMQQTTVQMWEDVPYIMQPDSIILYDDNCKPTIIQGGCLDVPYKEEINDVSIEDFMAKIPENASEQEIAQIQRENEVIRQMFEGIDFMHPNYPKIEIVPDMKVVYNEITGDIDNIYYRDKYCGEYTIHGEQAHTQKGDTSI